MTLTLLLPWFPILLGVGVGGRLLGRTRGLSLGVLCALFWVVLVQASVGAAIWADAWTVAALAAGAAAIAAMGLWSGATPPEAAPSPAPDEDSAGDLAHSVSEQHRAAPQHISTVIDQFNNWLEEHRHDNNPWPKFDEFIRGVMYQCCRAAHVRPYRLFSEGEELTPLSEPDPLVEIERLSARRGVVGHVATTGRSYFAGDETQGELVAKIANESQESIAWCFAVRRGTRRLGVVTVGQLDIPRASNKPLLCAVERLVGLFWCMLTETMCSRSAIDDDPVSGLHARAVFLRAAEQSLRDSYRENEPVAVAAIALEGLRKLNDSARWEVADELIREVGDTLRRKLRMDDRLGRFDGSRFIFLLRRVDSELASLIVTQVVSRVTAVAGDVGRWHEKVTVRCGVAGSGTEKPDLKSLIVRALGQLRRARLEDVPVASDLDTVSVVNGAVL